MTFVFVHLENNSYVVSEICEFTVYQCCLIRGLNVYLLSNDRGTDLISQNKEGLFSIFGMCNGS